MNTRRSSFVICLILIALVLTGCVGARMGVSWPAVGLIDYNGEQNIALAYNNNVAILSPVNGAPLRLINPLNGRAILDSENNPRNWVLQGSANNGAQFYALPIVLDEETVLVAANSGNLLQVDSVLLEATRSIQLEDKIVANVLVVDDILYVPYQNGGLSARSMEDYREIWRFHTEEGVWTQPLLVGEMLIVASIDHHVYALDRSSGQLIWSLNLGGSVASTPLLANDRLYVGSFNKMFFELSLDGRILSTYSTQNWVWGSPAIDERGVVYVADLSGYVHALDSERNLQEIWSSQIAERGIRSGPVVYQDRVIVASRDGKVYWLDRRDGALINAREIDNRPELLGDMLMLEPSESLDIDAPLLIVTSVDEGRLLIAFELDGRQTWVYPR
ncbi:MAG: PQQ-binding-like beta-propeller repeat protein [Chloroflexota bacterium]|nr:PQQ-binding-like beta-propeller repeat protein [Chloroflexota bacterium]MDE2946401.1 PQQ-binding-like beta-propeller repeat protein [Chloroflexota bacterium]